MLTLFLHNETDRKRSFHYHFKKFGIVIFLSCCFFTNVCQLRGDTHQINRLEISGWKLSEKPYAFGPQNLYEYIDGAADFFVAYGFLLLEGANYLSVSDADDSITIDIYDMGNKLNAFGVFQSKRSKEAPSLKIGADSFGADGYLCFYKDRYFVEIQSYIKSNIKKSQHLVMAKKVADTIQGDNSPPSELFYFPEPGRIKGSERYIKGGILGHAFLDRGIVCDYEVEEETVSAFFAFFPATEDAVRSFEQHKKFLNQSGQSIPLNGFGERVFVSQEPYHKNILIVQKGAFIIGVYDLSIAQKGIRILEGMIKGLSLR